jgi:Tol biopolymer transport system component
LPNFEHCAIWIMRSDGTHRRLVIPFLTTPTETNNFDPRVSPDGRRITFTRFGFRGVTAQVWVARINGTHAHPLTAPRLEGGQATWSPDGRHIVFADNSARPQSSIYVMRANGTAAARLATTPWPTNNFGPAYSPDGSQIAFSSDRRHPDLCCEELFVMRADGSHQHLVDTGIEGVIGVAWGTSPPVPAGSPGTLSRLPAGVHVSGAARYVAGCREVPPWLTSMRLTSTRCA